jgi:prevent-host-death family protein
MQTVQNPILYPERIEILMERVLGITQAREEFSTIVEQVQHQGDTYVISRHGKRAAAVVPIQVYEEWKRQRNEFFEFIRQAQQQAELAPEEAERLAAEAVRAARAET